MSIACPVRLSDDKNHQFSEKFFHFFRVCRLGYSKPLLCNGSRSELFPNLFPSTGMETLKSYKNRIIRCFFPNLFPSTGMETGRNMEEFKLTLTLSKPIPLNGDGNSFSNERFSRMHGALSKPIPLNGDGNIIHVVVTNCMNSFQTYSPQRGWKHPFFGISFCRFILSKPIPLNGDGNFLLGALGLLLFSFQTYSPQRGWKPF